MPLEAPCKDAPDLPFSNFEVAHKDVIGVAQNSIIKYKKDEKRKGTRALSL